MMTDTMTAQEWANEVLTQIAEFSPRLSRIIAKWAEVHNLTLVHADVQSFSIERVPGPGWFAYDDLRIEAETASGEIMITSAWKTRRGREHEQVYYDFPGCEPHDFWQRV